MIRSGFIAIAGRPNAGKSTLLNQVLGTALSIVTPKAQTTRERVLGILTEPERGQIVFIDTPGIHKAKEGGINAYMVNQARSALEGAAAVWYLVDPDSKLQHEETVLDLLREGLKGTEIPVFVLLNKVDVRNKPELLEEVVNAAKERGLNVHQAMQISGRRGRGVEELVEETWELLPEGPLYYPDVDQISDRPVRFFVAEKIREQLYMKLGQEIPYSCAVEILSFKEDATPPRIEAIIYVERDSQKGMVVGKGGQKIKEIGQAARQNVEEFLGQRVFLGLQVKVLKDWTRDPDKLKRMGYNLPKEIA